MIIRYVPGRTGHLAETKALELLQRSLPEIKQKCPNYDNNVILINYIIINIMAIFGNRKGNHRVYLRRKSLKFHKFVMSGIMISLLVLPFVAYK